MKFCDCLDVNIVFTQKLREKKWLVIRLGEQQ